MINQLLVAMADLVSACAAAAPSRASEAEAEAKQTTGYVIKPPSAGQLLSFFRSEDDE
jgi:hypothetical protein